jgi:hypothetical protein
MQGIKKRNKELSLFIGEKHGTQGIHIKNMERRVIGEELGTQSVLERNM